MWELDQDDGVRAPVPERMARVIARDRRSSARVTVATLSVDLALVASLLFGAWWTADAVRDGSVAGVVARFAVAILLGVYYLGLRATIRR